MVGLPMCLEPIDGKLVRERHDLDISVKLAYHMCSSSYTGIVDEKM